MSDNILIYSLVRKSNFIHTKLKLSPNTITSLNILNTIFSNYYLDKRLYKKKSFNPWAILLYVQIYLDCLDGYIARNYNKYSKLGEILDHGNDSMQVGIYSYIFMKKFFKNKKYNIPISSLLTIIALVVNFTSLQDKTIVKVLFGNNGHTNAYTLLIRIIILKSIIMYNDKKL